MARTIKGNVRTDDDKAVSIADRTNRLALPKRKQCYWVSISPGVALGYRTGKTSGGWKVRAADGKGGNWQKRLATADDFEDANGESVLSYKQAIDAAREMARGENGDSATRPLTVAEAIDEYEIKLKEHGARPANARRLRSWLAPSLMAKPVAVLTVRDLRAARAELAKTVKATTVNRECKSLKAALNLAAEVYPNIKNGNAWKVGLSMLPEDSVATECNVVLTGEQMQALVAAAYDIDDGFGQFVEMHAATGARTSQLKVLTVADLQMGAEPHLTLPSSLKGKNRRARTRKPFPISLGFAQRLKAAAQGKPATAPLLVRRYWKTDVKWFRQAVAVAGLPAEITPYNLRHTAITNALLAGVPVRLVASMFDTSVLMIERHYSARISEQGGALMRAVMFSSAAPTSGNVVPLAR